MKNIEFKIKENNTKTFNKNIRKNGIIPAVIYDKNHAISIVINHDNMLNILKSLDYKKDFIKLINVNKETKKSKINAIVKVKINNIQHHPFKKNILHIEFVLVS